MLPAEVDTQSFEVVVKAMAMDVTTSRVVAMLVLLQTTFKIGLRHVLFVKCVTRQATQLLHAIGLCILVPYCKFYGTTTPHLGVI